MKLTYHLSLVVRLAILASTLLACNPGEAASAPPNDNLANAQVIPTDSFSVEGTEVGATQESFEQSPNFAFTYGYVIDASVWYAWTPSVSGNLDVAVLNTSGNTSGTAAFLFLGPATPTRDTFVAGTVPPAESFSASVTAQKTYFFFVANNRGNEHDFVLKGTFTATSSEPVVTVTVKKPQAFRSTGAAGKVVVEVSPAPATALTIAYTLGGTAVNGSDYTMLSGSVIVPAGATHAAIKIKPMAGNTGTAKVKLTVVAGQGYTLGSPAKGKVLIVD